MLYFPIWLKFCLLSILAKETPKICRGAAGEREGEANDAQNVRATPRGDPDGGNGRIVSLRLCAGGGGERRCFGGDGNDARGRRGAAASIPGDAELEAEYAAENGYQFLITDPEGVYPEIINFKARLRELGFYTAGVDDGTLQTSVLDPLTMAAVNEVCRLNPQFSYHPSGVSRLMYWNVMNMYGYGDDLKTPLSGDYRALEQGAEGEAVTAVQNRLTELGYDSAAGYTFTPGVYDEGLQAAVEAFARVNNMTMDAQTGISAALQKRLFAEDAAPYAPGEGGETLSTAQRILDYFASPSSLMGLSLPNGVLWGVGFILSASSSSCWCASFRRAAPLRARRPRAAL